MKLNHILLGVLLTFSLSLPAHSKAKTNDIQQLESKLLESFMFSTSRMNPSTSQFETWASIETRDRSYTKEYIVSKAKLYCEKMEKGLSIEEDIISGPQPLITPITLSLLETDLLFHATTILCPDQQTKASQYINFN
jgi:hypothetical protein